MSSTEEGVMSDEDHWPLTDTRLRKKKLPPCCLVATILGILLVAAVIALVGLSAGVAIEHKKVDAAMGTTPTPTPTPTPVPATCTTPECVELSSEILSRLDSSHDPCKDFYKFACNKFDQTAIISHGLSSVGTLDTLAMKNLERLSSLMDSIDSTGEGAIAKAAAYYQSCLDTSEIEMSSLESLKALIANLGGWPLVGIESSRSGPWDINDPNNFLTELLYGTDAFMGFDVIPDPGNSSRNVLVVGQGGLTLPIDGAYNESSVLLALLMENMEMVLRAIDPMPHTNYTAAVLEILVFEAAIANFTDFDFDERPPDQQMNIVNFGNLSELMPIFNWTQNLKLAGMAGNFSVNFSAPVVVFAPMDFLAQLNDLIEITPDTVLENYAKWHLVYKLLPALGKTFADVSYDIRLLKTNSDEASQAPPRYQTCIKDVEQKIPFALARIFKDRYLQPGARDNISVVVNELRQALKQRISASDWLDQQTRAKAMEKVDYIIDFLAYPNTIANNASLNKIYASLNVSASAGYFMNFVSTTRFAVLRKLGGLDMFNNRSEWNLGFPLPPTIVNAAYNPNGNNIYILEGILDQPFFRTYWPNYFKFGTIGFVVGHELVHGFDANGRFYNQIGNFESWMSNATVKNFRNLTKCLINQYDQYSLPALPAGLGQVNGTLTLSENIADNGGLGTAYRAYKNMIARTGEVEEMLPGLPYTPEQLFFIGTAQPWCQVATLDAQAMSLQDVHTPSTLRANAFLSNSPEFAMAFNCSKGSNMNPDRAKCTIW